MNFLDLLGIDQDAFSWHDLALCAQIPDPDVFFEKYEKDKTIAKQVDEMCLSCPVMKQCAQYAIDKDHLEKGVWGGIYWNGSGAPDKDMNAHKTPEVWERIKEKMSE